MIEIKMMNTNVLNFVNMINDAGLHVEQDDTKLLYSSLVGFSFSSTLTLKNILTFYIEIYQLNDYDFIVVFFKNPYADADFDEHYNKLEHILSSIISDFRRNTHCSIYTNGASFWSNK